jgi:hypothetical protein
MCGSATNAKWAATNAREKQRMQTGGVQRMRTGVQRMRTGGATDVDRGCNECGRVQRMRTAVQRMRMGVQRMRQRMRRQQRVQRMRTATNAQKWGCAICASGRGVRVTRQTKWRWQGVLGGAHNLLENGRSSTERAKRVY